MSVARGAETAVVQEQWKQLHATLSNLNCKVYLIPPQPRLPDMVFTANAGLTVGRKFIPSNFRHKERAGEQPFFAKWMEQHGYEVEWLPEKLYFEGEGDALFGGDVLFCGYKFRSDIQSHRAIAEMLGCLAISVELVDPRFYHLDTCFCPLPDGGGFWFPNAFDECGQRAIREHVTDLIDVAPEEAQHFSCNAVVIDRDIVLPAGAPRIGFQLVARRVPVPPLAWARVEVGRARLPLPRITEDRMHQGRRRLQMPHHVYAAARSSGVMEPRK